MEATGVYWKPVWHVLKEHVTLLPGKRGAHPQRTRTQERGPAGARGL